MDGVGHNNPPDPIDEAIAPFQDAIVEAENWLDGTPVQTEEQMKAVDALIKDIRSAKSALEKAKKSEIAPLHDAWRSELARWKPTEEDIARRLKGLVALVDGFKRKLAAEIAEKQREAEAAARQKREEAEALARAAQPGNYADEMAAVEAKREVEEAQKAAKQIEDVKGLRSVQKHAIDDHKTALYWIAEFDKPALVEFVEDYVRRNFKTTNIKGVRVWTEREAF